MNPFQKIKTWFSSLFVHKEGEETAERKALPKGWRSRQYRGHFEGYAEVMEPKKNGRGYKTRRVYIGDFYVAHTDDRGWLLNKIFYLLLLILSFALWCMRIMAPYPINALWYGYLPQVLVVCGFLLMLRFLIERCFTPRKMILREYRQAVRNIRVCAVAVMALEGLSLVIVTVHALVTKEYRELQEAAFLAASAACMGVMYYMEKQMVYDVEENEDKDKVDGFEVE